MSRTLTIAQRELSSMFRVPAGWIIIALFAFLTGVLFVNQTLIPGQPGSLRYFFMYAGWLLIPIAPAISMRLMSEEYRSGSFEALRTAPAGDWSVTLGKYLGSVAYLILMLLPSIVYPIVLILVSEPAPDWGPILAGYLMLLLVGMLYLAIGMLASTLTASQTLAFLGTVMSLILLMVLTSVIANQLGVFWAQVLRSISITQRVSELAKGVIDTSTIAFFLIGSVWMLVLGAGSLEIRRLGRPRFYTILTTTVFVLLTGVAAGFGGYITHLKHARYDVTSTSVHKLSDRAERIVDRLTDETRIVLAVSRNNADAQSLDLVSDVVETYDESSGLISSRFIDLDLPQGIEDTKSLLRELADRERGAIEANLSALRESASLMQEVGSDLVSLSTTLAQLRDAIPATTSTNMNNRAVFEQRAALVRIASRDISSQSENMLSQLAPYINGETSPGDIFPFDTYAQPIEQVILQQVNQLDDLSAQLESFADANELEAGPRTLARPMVTQAQSSRDQLAQALDLIARLQRIDAVRVGRALETGETLLVIGSPEQGVAAVDLESLLLPSAAIEQAGFSVTGVIAPRTQDQIARALARLVAPTQPVLVFVHSGMPGELLEASQLYTNTVLELRERGIDCVEWAAVESPAFPRLDGVDPLGIRPRVFVIIAPDSTTQSAQSGLSGAKRTEAMGEVVERLVQSGENLLLSLAPSIFPSAGRADPLTDAIGAFGIVPMPGFPIVNERMGPVGRVADPVTTLIPERGTHPIAGAIGGLNTVLTWAIPMELREQAGVQISPLLTLAGNEETWGESGWITLWRRPAQSRQVMPNQPIYNETDDLRLDAWVLGASAQRDFSDRSQRLVVIGSNGWSGDAVFSGSERVIDGRVTRRWAGNRTLFDSSISWLAGLDDLIGAGTDARPIATIKALDGRQFSVIRWVLLAGMPGFILLLGVAFRLVFG
jgi:ABC-2 type transport system permease protein